MMCVAQGNVQRDLAACAVPSEFLYTIQLFSATWFYLYIGLQYACVLTLYNFLQIHYRLPLSLGCIDLTRRAFGSVTRANCSVCRA